MEMVVEASLILWIKPCHDQAQGAALEETSINQNIIPIVEFLAGLVDTVLKDMTTTDTSGI